MAETCTGYLESKPDKPCREGGIKLTRSRSVAHLTPTATCTLSSCPGLEFPGILAYPSCMAVHAYGHHVQERMQTNITPETWDAMSPVSVLHIDFQYLILRPRCLLLDSVRTNDEGKLKHRYYDLGKRTLDWRTNSG